LTSSTRIWRHSHYEWMACQHFQTSKNPFRAMYPTQSGNRLRKAKELLVEKDRELAIIQTKLQANKTQIEEYVLSCLYDRN
jgi:hypothetical protein